MTDAFYVPDGDRYAATEHTRGPWSPQHQHGGPPAALIAHVVGRAWPELNLNAPAPTAAGPSNAPAATPVAAPAKAKGK